MIQVSYCDPRYLLGSYPMWVNRDMGRSFSRRKRRARQVPRKANQVGRAYQGPSLTPVDVVTSHSLTSYWPHVEYIPTRWHPIGPTWSIIPLAGVLLAPHGVYSHSLASYWLMVAVHTGRGVFTTPRRKSRLRDALSHRNSEAM